MVNIESAMRAGSGVFSTGATIKAAPVYTPAGTFSLYPISNCARRTDYCSVRDEPMTVG